MFYKKIKDLKLSTKLPLKLVKVKIKPDTVESYSIFPLTFIYSNPLYEYQHYSCESSELT